MTGILKSVTLTISIHRTPAEVYSFVSDPANLPKWAGAFCRSVRHVDGRWIVETMDGPVQFRFVPQNEFGVLDHIVTLSSGQELQVPMRVVANGAGSEVLFTLFRWPAMSDEKHAEDIQGVERDLRALKHALEAESAR